MSEKHKKTPLKMVNKKIFIFMQLSKITKTMKSFINKVSTRGLLTLLMGLAMIINSQTITTICGTGTLGYSGNNGPAAAAAINGIAGQVSFDANGNIYFADTYNHAIRRIDKNTGVITTVAGTGTVGFSGDGGAATLAQLNYPGGVTVDNNMNIYICDYGNHRIRKIAPSGTITTICGNGTASSTGDGSLAINATINGPSQICIDPTGNLFFGQYNGDDKIRKIATTGIITTYCGTGVNSNTGNGGSATLATCGQPYAITSDPSGNIYFAAYNGNNNGAQVRKIDVNGTVTAFAGTGTQGYSGDGSLATAATMQRIMGISINNMGEMFISDNGDQRIRKVSTNSIISTYAGTGAFGFGGDGGAAASATLNQPFGIASYGCNTYFIDTDGKRIRKISNGTASVTAVTGATNYICVGESATLTANGANTYTWYPGALVGNTIVVNPTVTTSYSVNATTTIGCYGSASISQSVSACVGIQERNSNATKYGLYPNPNQGTFHLVLESYGEVMINNANGQKIYSAKLNAGTHYIDLKETKAGIYFLQVYENGKKVFTTRVIKE